MKTETQREKMLLSGLIRKFCDEEEGYFFRID